MATTLEHIQAELQSPRALGALLQVAVPASWPPGDYDRNALEFFCERLTDSGTAGVGWYGWYAISRDPAQVEMLVAAVGYMGPPQDGMVEIGFSVIPEIRNGGYATEIVDALVTHAFEHPGVQLVTARTLDSNFASTRVLLRCGFRQVGPGIEPNTIEYRRERQH